MSAADATPPASLCGSPLTTTASLYQLGWAHLLHGVSEDAVANLERARHAIANGAAPHQQLRPLVGGYAEVGGVGHVRRLEAELGA